MKLYQVVQAGEWPSGQDKPAAQLRFTAKEMRRRLGPPLSDADDLGSFQQWGLQLSSGRLVLLAQYDDTPEEGIVAYIDSQDNVHEALAELSRAFDFESSDFIWVRDERTT